MFARIAPPFVCSANVLYLIFGAITPGIGYDRLRFFAVALYDAWMPLAAIIIVTSIPLCQPKFARHTACRIAVHSIRREELL
ncbi:hypothetical protein PRIPAC_81512, partial [Pristionchus pacificus]|uniref:Uncharacterized protein n=1 Tax=Pristionchus pacificus TaxID=54126 RepID=A0A2A6CMC4_PRIPA